MQQSTDSMVCTPNRCRTNENNLEINQHDLGNRPVWVTNLFLIHWSANLYLFNYYYVATAAMASRWTAGARAIPFCILLRHIPCVNIVSIQYMHSVAGRSINRRLWIWIHHLCMRMNCVWRMAYSISNGSGVAGVTIELELIECPRWCNHKWLSRSRS